MKNFTKRDLFKLSIILVLCVFVVYYMNTGTNNNETEIKKAFIGNDISLATQITCTYPQILNVNYFNKEISHNLPEAEVNPIIFTFSEIEDPVQGQLSYIDSTQTITNVPIIKLSEDEEKVIYLDGTGENYFSTHTIYKKFGVSTYTKSVSLFGIPSGSLGMGSCVGY